MSNIPDTLKYAASHEWLRLEDGVGTVGITDHAQNELSDIVFVELPEVGQALVEGASCAVVESVKSASDINAPASGKVIEINPALDDNPALANDDPYGEGWFFIMKVASAPDGLMAATGYSELIGES